MYKSIKDDSKHFKAFAVLPMTHPKEAAEELERCVKELKMVGALINGNQLLYKNGKQEVLFYDTPEYDVLWKKFVELDVPLYIHPTFYSSPGEIAANDPDVLAFYKEYPQITIVSMGFFNKFS